MPPHNAPSALHRCTRCARWHDRGAGLLCNTCQRMFVLEREMEQPPDEWHTESRWDHFREDYL